MMDIDMVLEECCVCGVSFAMTRNTRNRLKECHNTFYCPAGHAQNYPAKSDAERLREQVDVKNSTIAALEEAREKQEKEIKRLRRLSKGAVKNTARKQISK